MGQINLFGASGHAKVISDVVKAQGDVVGCYYDDNPHSLELNGVSIKKPTNDFLSPIIIAIGSNKVRKLISEKYDIVYGIAIHPSAIISSSVSIGCGSVVMHGTIIQADARIGDHCIINTGSSVDHECKIGNFVHLSPHSTLCGNVEVGEGTWIGAGAVVIQGVKIGRWCTIGAGSVVVRDIPDGSVAYGNPCRIQNRKQEI